MTRKRQQHRAERADATRRAWVGQELGDRATAGLVLDYVQLHADLAEQIRLSREAFALPAANLQSAQYGTVHGTPEPDRAVAGKVIPDWPDDQIVNGEGWEQYLPDQNWEAVKREEIRAAERLRLGRLEGDYQALLAGDLAGVPGWPLHPRLRAYLASQIHDDPTTALLWGCLGAHRLLASVAHGGAEPLVKRRKAMEARWRYLIEAFERDLGRRPPSKGRRNLRGRPAVEYVDETGVRRFG